MGSWNKTCGLSNLHITYGTPVYVFVLERNAEYEPCYTTNLFSPLLLPFESVYNDYGGGEYSGGVALDIVMDAVRKNLVEQEVGENQYHDIAVKREGFGVEQFFEAVHEQRLMATAGYRNRPTPIHFTMMRKDVVDHILDTREIVSYVGDGEGTFSPYGGDELNYIKYQFKDVVASIAPLLEQVKADQAQREWFSVDGLYKYRDQYIAAGYITDDSRFSRLVNLSELMRTLLFKDGSPEAMAQLAELLTVHAMAVFIESFMQGARKSWIPGGHEGDQSESGEALQLLGTVINTVVEKEKADWALENEE